MKIRKSCATFFLFSALSQKCIAQESQTLIIESQVKGSQAQPKVIYIVPWQNMQSSVDIEQPQAEIRLPEIKPIYPKAFKQHILENNKNNSAERTGP